MFPATPYSQQYNKGKNCTKKNLKTIPRKTICMRTVLQPPYDFNKTQFLCKPIWNARVSICGTILYKITSWQWMQAEHIIHMETNKENNVSLTEWQVCVPATDPAAASLPMGRQPAVSPAACHPRLPTVPLSLLSAAYSFTPTVKGLKDQTNTQPTVLTLLMCIKHREPWGFSVLDVCQIIHKPNKCTPPPPLHL